MSRITLSTTALRRGLDPNYLIPNLESLCALGTILPCLQLMPARTKVLANWAEGRQKALRVPG